MHSTVAYQFVLTMPCNKSNKLFSDECLSDHHCAKNENCFNNHCHDPCKSHECGKNAKCSVKNHKATCSCLPNHRGDPYHRCTHYECISNLECDADLACHNEKCVDPCEVADACGENAECPNSDCPHGKACVSNKCVNPCNAIMCGNHATCKVESHKAACACPEGFEGDPMEACTETGCRSNMDCKRNERCNLPSKECMPVCTATACAMNAICTAANHRKICTCHAPFQGDGYDKCIKVSK